MTALIRDIALALRNLSRNRGRSLVGVLTVASGVVAFLLAGGFIAWIFQDLREATIHSQLGHAQIVRPSFLDKGIADPYAFLLPSDSLQLPVLEGFPGVVSIAPRLVFSGLIGRGDATVPFVGEGIDPGKERPISSRIEVLAGEDLISIDERRVLLGEGLSKSLGAAPGDTVVLLTTTSTRSTNAIELKVAGIFATATKEYDDSAIRVPIGVARKLMRVDGATSWVVVLESTEKTGGFVDAARERLPVGEFQVVHWTELADFYNKTVVLFSKQVNVVKIIIGLIIVLTITNTLTMSVLERTTEIGTSLAIGLRGRLVMRLFVIEGLLIGIAGGSLGVAVGYLLAQAISLIGIPMPPPPGMAHGYIGQIIVTGGLAIDAYLLALVTTLLASVLPAWKAGRMNVVDALRYSQ